MPSPTSLYFARIDRVTIAIAAAIAICCATLAAVERGGAQNQSRVTEPPMGGIHWARGERPPFASTTSPDLQYHGGPVMHGTFVMPILSGTSWSSSSFIGDKETGLASFYEGIGNSSYADTNTEYSDGTGNVSPSVTYGGALIDLTTAPRSGNRAQPILNEVCAQLGNNAVPNGYYPVYVDTPRGHSRFCAWHSAGTCPNGVTVQFAFFYNLDGDSGCDPQDSSGLHSEGMAALANTSGHELSEALTDRHLNAWYDSSGAENADKCAWSFGTPLLKFTNSTQWKIQGNWSNKAFDSSTGYPNLNGQDGCIDGGNYK